MAATWNSQNHAENVLIFLEPYSYNPSTIQSGAVLAKAFGCPFHVWYGTPANEKKEKEQLESLLSESKVMSSYFEAESFILSSYHSEKDFRTAFETIVQELSITRLVLAGSVESRWEELLFGSSIHYLMNKFPHIEVQLVSPNLPFSYEDWDYKQGKEAVLADDEDGYYLSYRALRGIKGTFFREKNAEFETGIFISIQGDQVRSYTISAGNVKESHKEVYRKLTTRRGF
ncbi:hypothetical protein [Planococcus sp. CAU13]|uniref:hypothetical protein n=1 Tax=Planococcus sp. CAU13 TaxID=1541197 RepID=UPI00053003E8|nr:hypothetical protein [Planococcus sp. CAU13]